MAGGLAMNDHVVELAAAPISQNPSWQGHASCDEIRYDEGNINVAKSLSRNALVSNRGCRQGMTDLRNPFARCAALHIERFCSVNAALPDASLDRNSWPAKQVKRGFQRVQGMKLLLDTHDLVR